MLPQTRSLTWRHLVHFTEAELQWLDVALVHLLCAEGLPRTESLDIPAILAWIDQMAEAVQCLTEKLLPRLDSLPDEVRHSEAKFRVACLVSVVQRDFGITTDNRLNDNPNFSDSRYVFLHGIFEGCGGTCANLPILYAAIARRLGYPLKLVRTAAHLFARWEGPDGERFNIECTTRGLDCPPDTHYLTWPFPVDALDMWAGKWLESKTPRAELSGFLLMRSACLLDNDRFREAAEAAAWASAVYPDNRLYLRTIERTLEKWERRLWAIRPLRFPLLVIHLPAERRFPASLAPEVELQIGRLETLEELIWDPEKEQEWWRPLNASDNSVWPAHVPMRIDVTRMGPGVPPLDGISGESHD